MPIPSFGSKLNAFESALKTTLARKQLEGDFVAWRLARSEVILCAAPAYLDRRGRPSHPEDLAQHDAIMPMLPNAPRELTFHRGKGESLARFTEAYARLARLPAPSLAPVDVADLIRRVTVLESRRGVVVEPGPALTLVADATQLEQALINLIRNGVEAAQELGGGVRVSWRVAGGALEMLVEDEGPGLPATSNLFVPFFSTKPGGSGIGLVLTRQIAEGHGGSLSLENRTDRSGVCARLRIPLPKR